MHHLHHDHIKSDLHRHSTEHPGVNKPEDDYVYVDGSEEAKIETEEFQEELEEEHEEAISLDISLDARDKDRDISNRDKDKDRQLRKYSSYGASAHDFYHPNLRRRPSIEMDDTLDYDTQT